MIWLVSILLYIIGLENDSSKILYLKLRFLTSDNITSKDSLGKGKLLITYHKDIKEKLNDKVNFTHLNISIGISAAITALTRLI